MFFLILLSLKNALQNLLKMLNGILQIKNIPSRKLLLDVNVALPYLMFYISLLNLLIRKFQILKKD